MYSGGIATISLSLSPVDCNIPGSGWQGERSSGCVKPLDVHSVIAARCSHDVSRTAVGGDASMSCTGRNLKQRWLQFVFELIDHVNAYSWVKKARETYYLQLCCADMFA